MNSEDTTLLVTAFSNMPYLNISDFSGLQLLNTAVVLIHFWRLSLSKVSQSKYLRTHLTGPSSFLHMDFQHVAYRSIDSKYHGAPKIYNKNFSYSKLIFAYKKHVQNTSIRQLVTSNYEKNIISNKRLHT